MKETKNIGTVFEYSIVVDKKYEKEMHKGPTTKDLLSMSEPIPIPLSEIRNKRIKNTQTSLVVNVKTKS